MGKPITWQWYHLDQTLIQRYTVLVKGNRQHAAVMTGNSHSHVLMMIDGDDDDDDEDCQFV